MSIKIIQNLNFTAFSVNFTPVYNFINDRLADESAVLRPLSYERDNKQDGNPDQHFPVFGFEKPDHGDQTGY